jgi:hypothetical protein
VANRGALNLESSARSFTTTWRLLRREEKGRIPAVENVTYLSTIAVLASASVIAAAIARWEMERARQEHSSIAERRSASRDVSWLARQLGLTEESLRSFEPEYVRARAAGYRGEATESPTRATSALQKRIAKRVLKGMHVAPSRLPLVVSGDPANRVADYFRALEFDAEAVALLVRLVTHRQMLPPDAPTTALLASKLASASAN